MALAFGTALAMALRMLHRTTSALVVIALGLAASGCAPRVFSGGTAIAIVGTRPEPVAVAVPARIELREKVQFARDSAVILEVSHEILDEAAAQILAHPQIRRIRIEGHASSDGDDAHNLELSDRRARSVREYLVGKGVAAALLEAQGFGETQPVASNDSATGREANRRVELHVVETDDGAAAETAAP